MALFFIIFFSIYAAINYYIFIRGWQALSALPQLRIFYLILFLLASLAYFISRFLTTNVPNYIYDFFLWIGSIWFAYIVYLLLSILLIDLVRLVNWKLQFFPESIYQNYERVKQITALSVFIISSIVILLGYLNTRNIKINSYDITLKKGSGNLSELNAVLVADFHMTPVNDGKLLKDIVAKINSINPDIVLMPGDIVDDKVEILRSRNIGKDFRNIKTKYGVFASNGNHEFITGVEESVKYMREIGINVVRDSSELIAESFYIIGREDRAMKNFTGIDRQPLGKLIEKVEKNFPIIVLDHTPLKLEEIVNEGADLQLSGHTHHGQLFPGNLITSMIYEVSWGYLKKGSSQFYVTSGVGTWGPPVRTGSDAEIVNLKIKFVE